MEKKTLTVKSSSIISTALLRLLYFLPLMTGHTDLTIVAVVSVLGLTQNLYNIISKLINNEFYSDGFHFGVNPVCFR